jgi:hypothetical protein
MGNHLWLIFVCILPLSLQAQLYGTITDQNGDALPFASVYLQGTSIGTTSNGEGTYELDLSPGSHTIVFQYVGYRQTILQVDLSNQAKELNVVLEEEAVELSTIEIRADEEDPAYAIIRKAIAKRKYYLELVEAYSCDVYIKGSLKVLDAPEAILGQEIGDMGGLLDSTGRGIIYLSESESRLHFQQPRKVKEVMVSSKVSGNDNGFSFNSASDMDFDFYRNYIDYGRQIISPIANGAFSYYDYRLIGTLFDEEGRLINKIELLPKRPEDPVYRGIIYIVEDLWLIQSVDVYLTGGAINQPALEQFQIQQIHLPVKDPDVWQLFSQTITLDGDVFGFKFGGDFTGIYSDYDLKPVFEKGFFDNEVFTVSEEANEKGAQYFDTIRPLPLTQEESLDYIKKDSLQILRESKPFLDSLDKENNKFTISNLMLGYTYSQTYEQNYFSITSPLNTLTYNTVQGATANFDLSFRKVFDRENTRWLEVRNRLAYGHSGRRYWNEGTVTFNFNRTRFTRLILTGGSMPRQFNQEDPISPSLNSFYTVNFRRNYMKLLNALHAGIQFQHEVWNGGLLRVQSEFARRNSMTNTGDYSFFFRDSRAFTSNNPQNPASSEPSFPEHQIVTVGASLRLRINQKFISYPKRKFILGSALPDLILHYRKGIAIGASGSLENQLNYDFLALQLKEDEWKLGLWGYLQLNAEAGMFLNDPDLLFVDYRHFNGNQTVFGNPFNYQDHFFLLPYYDFSTKSPYLQAHLQHHFEGFILDKIPGVRNLGLTTVLGGKYLYTEEGGNYWEVSFGIDRIGINLFRFLRLDLAASFQNGSFQRFGPVIGFKLPPIN